MSAADPHIIRIGTRGSKLALWQAHHVESLLKATHPGIEIQIVPIKTTGDLILDRSLAKVGGKGLFLKEIEDALLADHVDIAVHSMKDVPAQMPKGLVIGAVLEREDPRDALISRDGTSFGNLPAGAKVGSSSLRRVCQLRRSRPDLNYVDVRGNVDTRLKKLKDGEFDAIVLAAAGLNRLGLASVITHHLDIIPSVGQGAIGIECREGQTELLEMLKKLNHDRTADCVLAERAFLAVIGGGCEVPVGCHAVYEDDRITIAGLISDVVGSRFVEEKMSCDVQTARMEATSLSNRLLDAGGRLFLKQS